jgi:hypothetical protein
MQIWWISVYQKYCETGHSTVAELPHLADKLSFKNLKAECMVDCFGLTNLLINNVIFYNF